MRERIGVLFIQSQEGFGADSAVHAHLMRHLDRDRFDVHVACTGGRGEKFPESLIRLQQIPDVRVRLTDFLPGVRERTLKTVVKSAPELLSSPLDLKRLCDYVRQGGIRVIHSSDRPRDSLYSVALGKLTGAKSVVHIHVKWSEEYSAPAKWAVAHADAAFSISKYVTRSVIDMGRRPDSIHTILNCVDPDRFDPNITGDAVRRELGVPTDSLVLTSISRLFSWKGQRELLRAFAQVRRKFRNVVLLIVGADAPHEKASFMEELKQLATELEIADFVRFTGGRADIPQVLAASDVFTLPSFEEPFGLVFLEAMAMQKPVIAIDNGGTPEVVAHGETGLLSPPWDVPALAANIETLLESSETRLRMGERGRQRVLQHFTPKRMADDASEAYRAIVGTS